MTKILVDSELLDRLHNILNCGAADEDIIVDAADELRAAIESKVLELEAIDAARTSAVQDAIDNAAIYQDQLTAYRQQVERLVEALKCLRDRLFDCSVAPILASEAYDSYYQQIVEEALAAVEKGRWNAKVSERSAAGAESAPLPGYVGDNKGEQT